MAKYKLTYKKSVNKDLRSIPNQDVTRIRMRIEALAENPRPVDCKKLVGQERYRVRQGIYRIIYEIRDHELIVTVVKIGHRSSVYKQ